MTIYVVLNERGQKIRGPQLCYPNFKRAPVVIRFNPNRYALQHDRRDVPLRQRYRSIFAVGTQDTVFIYDTEQSRPIATFGQLHYATYNDLAWYPVFSHSDLMCGLLLEQVIRRTTTLSRISGRLLFPHLF